MIPRRACLWLIVPLLFAISLASQQDANTGAVSVSVDPAHVTLNTGQTQRFSADVKGVPAGTEIIWAMMEKHGASISQDGVFRANTMGIYHIMALVISDGNLVRSRFVRVTALAQYDAPVFR
jgi:hypothetical protein